MADKDIRNSAEYQVKLSVIHQHLHSENKLEDILWTIEEDLLDLMQAERITVYKKEPGGKEIVSWFKTGDVPVEIRVPLSPASIAGYVAMSHQPVKIDDVYDQEALNNINPDLKFDFSFDQESGFLTRAMLVTPIKFKDSLLGVLQIINKKDNDSGAFDEEDCKIAEDIAQSIAEKLRYDTRTTDSPFDYLLKKRLIGLEQLEEFEAMAARGDYSVAHLLVSETGLLPEEVGASLEHYYQVPFMKYDPETPIDTDLLDQLNRNYLIRQMWLPVAGDMNCAVILIDDPNDSDRVMEIHSVLNAKSFEFRVGIPEDILRFLGVDIITTPEEPVAEQPQEVNMDDLIGQLDVEKNSLTRADFTPTELVDENAAVVVQLVNKIIADGIRSGASDIHVEPTKGKSAASIRMRVDGICRPVFEIPASHIRAVVTRIKVMSNLDITETRLPQDGKMAVRLSPQETFELRVATLPTVNGESAVLRVLAAGEAMPIEKMNLSEANDNCVRKLLQHPHGIFLVVGPTGSGKTTTLHALLGHINTPEKKIWTAEDPVEITQNGLQQVQVNSKIKFDFARALRAFLRADPDVILIGEMRDYETAHSGIEASLTGHLVFSTLHTNSAPETVTRLLDMGLDPINFADALIGVLAQRLVRTLCKACKEAYKPEEEELQRLIHLYGEDLFPELEVDPASLKLCRPKGCDTCAGTGYKGRTGVHELLVANKKIKALMTKSATVPELLQQAMADGMRTIMQDGVRKIIKGQIDLAQLRAVAVEQE